MKRFFIAAALLIGLCSPVKAQFSGQGIGGGGFASPVPAAAACTPGAAATNFLARTSGLSATQTGAYCVMINGLVSDGMITGDLSGATGCGTVLAGLWVLAAKDKTTAYLNLCGTSFGLTETGTITCTADVGCAGDVASQAFLNTSFNFTTAGSVATLNNTSIGAYVRSTTPTAACAIMGVAITSNFTYFIPVQTGGTTAVYGINDGTFPTFSNSNPQGAWVVSRTSSTAKNVYLNGSSSSVASSATAAAGAQPGNTMVLFAFRNNNAVTTANWCPYQASAFFVGRGLTGAEAVLINNRINTFVATVSPGSQIY
jgi:hypothetical protein